MIRRERGGDHFFSARNAVERLERSAVEIEALQRARRRLCDIQIAVTPALEAADCNRSGIVQTLALVF
ncbi:hypothetical protein HUU05_25865 [candidate division KSB1 bacterium]|nr:hypothetical protein [candidate division KSB1 bacterium]